MARKKPDTAGAARRQGQAQRRSQSYWAIVWRQFRRQKLAMGALVFIILLFLVAIFAGCIANDRPIIMRYHGTLYIPAIKTTGSIAATDFKKIEEDMDEGDWAVWPLLPYGPAENVLEEFLDPPSARHPLGTDHLGRDVLSRMVHGSRVSLSVGFVAVAIYVVIGVIFGSLAGYFRGWADIVISRFIEIMICFPSFFLILTLIAFLQQNIFIIMIVIGLTGWPGVARLVRGEFFKQREMEYVMSARALGLGAGRIMFRHVLPNSVAPVLVSATFGVAGAILVESSLSYLGFGVPEPTASWGRLLASSKEFVDFAWWLVLFPGLAIFATITSYNLVGEALRDAIDPRLRQ
jgi:peptide/nickel transport system permease protein